MTFYNVTLWPGQFDGMLKLLKKGKAVWLSGELYIIPTKLEHDPIAWLLKFCLRDSLKLISKRNKQQKESENEQTEKEEISNKKKVKMNRRKGKNYLKRYL